MRVPAIILAAGASRRLGQPKQLVSIDGETLLARTVRIATECACDPIVIVLGAQHEAILASVDLSQTHAVINSNWEQGIATSIRAGIEALLLRSPSATSVLLLVCDQPRLTADHLRALLNTHASDEQNIVASHYAGTAGIPAIFPANQFSRLRSLRGDAGARSLLRDPASPIIMVRFEGGEIDIDTPADLEENLQA